VPVSRPFLDHVAAYLEGERPADSSTDSVFVVLKGPRRSQSLSAYGLDEILDRAPRRLSADSFVHTV
jgi:integrase/recombinase XerD